MNSSTKPNLSAIGSTIKKLNVSYHKFAIQQHSRVLPLVEILGEVTDKETESLKSMHNAIRSLPGVGDKVSALLLRNLHYAISYKIIQATKWPQDHYNLKIPVDIVICESLNKILRLETSAYCFNPQNDFQFLNNIFHDQLKDNETLLMIEDLWFWGYFNQKNVGKVRKHTHLNYDKIYAEKWVQPKELLKVLSDKSEEYRKIINSCI